MKGRRRYDTEALVGQLRAERRTGVLLTVAGVGVLSIIALLYFVSHKGENAEGEKGSSPEAKAGEPSGPSGPSAATGPSAPDPKPEPPKAPEPPKPATVTVTLSKKGLVWLDKKKLGNLKDKVLELPPGTYVVKAKLGPKPLTQTLEIKGGEKLEVVFDHKTRKVTVKDGS